MLVVRQLFSTKQNISRSCHAKFYFPKRITVIGFECFLSVHYHTGPQNNKDDTILFHFVISHGHLFHVADDTVLGNTNTEWPAMECYSYRVSRKSLHYCHKFNVGILHFITDCVDRQT